MGMTAGSARIAFAPLSLGEGIPSVSAAYRNLHAGTVLCARLPV